MSGFTLLELIVVLAGLGILSSLAISNTSKYLDYAKVDEAKSLLNKAAAKCLQGLRSEGNRADFLTRRSLFDAKDSGGKDLEDILTAERLATTGYKFTNEFKSCGKTSIVAISEEDSKRRYPGLTFNITTDGRLSKCATDDGSDTESAAISWAGKCVLKGEELIAWQKYDAMITEKKAECINNMNSWLENNNNRGKYTKAWNESATSGCPSGPPKVENKTCTPNGCNKTIYGYKGVIVSTGDTAEARKAYEDYEIIQKGKECATATKALRDEKMHTSSDGISVGKCGGDTYWFFRGEEVSAVDWKKSMCNENKQNLLKTTHSGPIQHCGDSPVYICDGKELTGDNAQADFDTCLANNKDAQCTQALNNDAVKKSNGGPYTSPTPKGMLAPIGKDCGETYWYCSESGKIHREPGSREKYEADKDCEQACQPRDAALCSIFKSQYWCCNK